MDNAGVKLFYDTVLQKSTSNGEGKSCPNQTEALNVTEASQYDNLAEREYAEQEKLKQWYETNAGYTVWKRKCELCGKDFYTINYFRKYCHLTDCRSVAKQNRNEQRKREHHSEHICSVCSASFISKRTDAKFCSNACRQKAYREKRYNQNIYSSGIG